MATVRLYCGGNQPARAAVIDRALGASWGRALLITPSHGYATRRREELLAAHGGAWGNPVQQFTRFAEALLQGEGVPVRRVADLERRLLLEQCLHALNAAGKLGEWPVLVQMPGLASHLLRVITSLKQAAVEPEDFSARTERLAGASALDGLVAAVYTAYQDALKAAGAYDVPGIYWQAELHCRQAKPKLLEAVDLLALDGFDDFTPSEFRLIASLAPHLKELVFGLNYDTAPNRQDLYVLPRQTAQHIMSAFETAIEAVPTPEPRTFVEFAAQHLFWRDRPQTAEGLMPNLTVIGCSDLTHEVETIGRRVKALILDEGVAPAQIAVVFRTLDETAAPVRAAFAEFQIPLRIRQRPRLVSSSLGAFVLRLLEASESWAREPVLDVLVSPWFRPKFRRQAGTVLFPLLARHAQVIAGYEEWDAQLVQLEERLAGRMGQDVRRLARRVPGAAAAAQSLHDHLRGLRQLWDALPAQAPRREHAAAFDALLSKLRVERAAQALDEASGAAEHAAAAGALRRALALLADTPGAEHSQAQAAFLDELRDVLEQTDYEPPQPPDGVNCLDAGAMRNHQFDYVFFGGLNEGLIPLPPAINAVYSDADLARLHKAGIPLEGRSEHSQRERLLFHHVLTGANKHLTLSWRLTRGGREAAQSHLLTEVLDLLPPTVQEPLPHSDSFLAKAEELASLRDLRNLVFRGLPTGHPNFKAEFAATRFAAAVEKTRNEPDVNHFDGVLQDARLLDLLGTQFGPDTSFSVSRLEGYIDCPFSFFQQHVLRLDDTEVAEFEFDPMLRGTILHEALRRFHGDFPGMPIESMPEAAAVDALHAAVEQAFQEHGWKSGAPGSLVDVEKRRMHRTLERYLQITRQDGKHAGWAPQHFEVAFGRAPREDADPLSREECFVLETSAGPVRFSGRIDRIDTQGEAIRLIDYKSGRVPCAGDIISGRTLQLSVYALAAEELLLPGAACAEAWFLRVGHKDALEALRLGQPRYEEREQIVCEAICGAIAGIRTGRFAPAREKGCCRNCGDTRACRYDESRMERKGLRNSLGSSRASAESKPR